MGTGSNRHTGDTAVSLSKLSVASHVWDKLLDKCVQSNLPGENLYEFPLGGQAPFGVSISAPGYLRDALPSSPFSSRHLVDGILRELKLHTARIRQRRVPWIRWQLPQCLFDGAEATEIMYFLGRQFKLSDTRDHYYSVVFDFEDLNSSKIALFKGLGFNSLEINFNNPQQLSAGTLRTCANLAHDFHFDCLTLNLTRPMPELLAGLRETELPEGKLPCSIVVDQFEQNSLNGENFYGLFTGLRDLGYRVLGNDCFVASDTSLALAQIKRELRLTSHGYNCQNVRNILGLGPGNTSNWGSLRHVNPEDLSDYLRDDFEENVTTPFLSNTLKAVLDQLLCYHQLDLRYFRDRYKLDIPTAIEAAWAGLKSQASGLYTTTQNQLSLTTEGILKLSELCDALAAQLANPPATLPANTAVAE